MRIFTGSSQRSMRAAPGGAIMVTETDLADLKRDGFLVIPKLIGTDTTTAVRTMMEHTFGAWPRQICESAMFLGHDKQMEKSPDTVNSALRGRRPVIMSGNYRHAMRHPIYAPILGDIASDPAMLYLQERLLRPNDPSELKLMQQLLIRSDPEPGGRGGGRLHGWHVRTFTTTHLSRPTDISCWWCSKTCLSCRSTTLRSRGSASITQSPTSTKSLPATPPSWSFLALPSFPVPSSRR